MMSPPLRRRTSLLIVISLSLASLLLDTNHYRAATAHNDDDYEAEVVKGKDSLRRRDYEEALKSFKRANEMRGMKSAECFNLMAETYLASQDYNNAIESADKVIEFAGDDKQLIVKAYNNKGLALQFWADKKDQKKLQLAEAMFRKAVAMEDPPPIVRYNLGVVLMQLNRDAEGIAELKQFLQVHPTGQFVDRATKLIDNPRRARENYAPDFSFTTLQGEHFSLEELRGKVVVLDFWGTWCRPCVESVPSLRSMHKKYAKEPSFVLLGISSDRDEDNWREFTEKNKMDWPQYRDKDRLMQRAFGVRAFPTYVVIDHEGIVRYQSDGEQSVELQEAIKKQVKLVAKNVEAR